MIRGRDGKLVGLPPSDHRSASFLPVITLWPQRSRQRLRGR